VSTQYPIQFSKTQQAKKQKKTKNVLHSNVTGSRGTATPVGPVVLVVVEKLVTRTHLAHPAATTRLTRHTSRRASRKAKKSLVIGHLFLVRPVIPNSHYITSSTYYEKYPCLVQKGVRAGSR
jgi:hypothetical protein